MALTRAGRRGALATVAACVVLYAGEATISRTCCHDGAQGVSYRLTRVLQRFVQVGRVCLITHGADEGKLCVIVDVIDSSRALVDGPSTINGVKRQPMLFTRLSLTDIVVKIQRCDASVLVARAGRLCPHKHFVVRDLMLAQERAVADAAEGVQGCRCGRQVGQDLRCEEARSAQGPREPHGL